MNEMRPTTIPAIINLNGKKGFKTSQLDLNSTTSKTNAISALLLLTPVLERSLGDVLASSLLVSGTTKLKVREISEIDAFVPSPRVRQDVGFFRVLLKLSGPA